MTQPVKAHEGTHPVHVGLFGAQAVVAVADVVAQLVEQAGASVRRIGSSELAIRPVGRAGPAPPSPAGLAIVDRHEHSRKLYIHTVSLAPAAGKRVAATGASP